MENIIYDFYSDLFDTYVHLPPDHLMEDRHVIPEVLPSDIRHAIMSVRNRTAPGPDRIRPEQLKNLPPVLINTLARLFTRYLSECKVPKQWKTSKTVLLYKKGDPHDIGNYRPICLLSGLQLNLDKTIFMRNGWVSDAQFSLNGTNLSDCTNYVYLGRELNMMNDLATELGRRRRAAWGVCKSIEDVVKKTKNTRLRAHLFNTTVFPALTYGSQTWAFRKQEKTR
ncbi:hypothetical protein RB195_023809 [Necator americanus]